MAALPKDIISNICSTLNETRETRYDYRACWGKFKEFRDDGVLCDVTVKCRDTTYDAHKCILSVASPYFQALFTTMMTVDANSGDTTVVDLSDYSNNTVETLLDFMYASEHVTDLNVAEILRLAEFLQYDWLVSVLVHSVRPLINVNNCYTWYEVAKTSGVKVLTTLTKSVIMSNIGELVAMVEYQDVVPHLRDIVREKDPELQKQFVFVCRDKDSKNHIVDFASGTIEMRRDGPTLTACDSSVQLWIVHRHRLLMISTYNTYVRDCPYYHRDYFENNTKVEIQAYNHCSRNYKLLHYVEPCKLVAKVHLENNPQSARPNTPFKISSFAYNGIETLYMLLKDKNDLYVVSKLNLENGEWAENWIAFKPTSQELRMCESKHLGSLLIDGLYDIYDAEKFMFHQGGEDQDHTPQPLNVSFEWKEIYKKAKNKKWDGKLVRSWEAVTLNGNVYLLVSFSCELSKVYVYELNPESVAWEELFVGEVPQLCYLEVGGVLESDNVIYCSLALFSPGGDFLAPLVNRLYRVDFERKVLEDSGIDTSLLTKNTTTPYRYNSVPAYFML